MAASWWCGKRIRRASNCQLPIADLRPSASFQTGNRQSEMERVMPTVKVRNVKNEEVGEVELSDAVFGAPLNEGLIHAAVRNFMANARQGTSATKTRGDVSGAGRKL